ncbi:MAG: sulfurase, partial [Ilumatobacteraceae bacterium]
ALGDAVLDVGMRIKRCVMTTRQQPGGVERDLDVLRTINRERDGFLAVGALVVQPGVVHVGDRLTPI